MASIIYLAVAKAVPGNSGLIIMARILGANRQAVTSATFSSIAYQVTDITSALPGASGTISPINSAVFDNLQLNDPTWDADSITNPSAEDGLYGYNFKFTMPAASFMPSGDRFQVDFAFTPVSGQPFRFSVSVPTFQVYV